MSKVLHQILMWEQIKMARLIYPAVSWLLPDSGNMIEAAGTSSEQYTVKASPNSQVYAGTLIRIQDESVNNIVTFRPARNFNYLVYSSSDLKMVQLIIYVGAVFQPV